MSALNCKPGDLAIVVKSYAGNEGKIVRCVRLVAGCKFRLNGSNFYADAWVVDPPLQNFLGIPTPCADFQLRPIRPLDELDDITRDEEVAA